MGTTAVRERPSKPAVASDTPGATNDTLNIFISHKHEDEEAVRELEKILHGLGPEEDHRFNVFSSGKIRGGEDWWEEIQKSLVDSNLLLLLYTDLTRN